MRTLPSWFLSLGGWLLTFGQLQSAGGLSAATPRAVVVLQDPDSRVGFRRMPGIETGILVTNVLSDAAVARNHILENGSGVALGDVDGDGWCDVYFCRLEGPNRLYRNLGGWRFETLR